MVPCARDRPEVQQVVVVQPLHGLHDILSVSVMTDKPLVGVIMGSTSDWDTMPHAVDVLDEFGVAHE